MFWGKKLIAACAAVTIAAGTVSFANIDRGERVTVIVEVKGGAVLEAEKARDMGIKLFCETGEAAEIESDIKTMQAEVQSDIKNSVDHSAETGYTYTYVFNGFAMEVYPEDIDKIRELNNVENVYISRTYELDDDSVSEYAPYLDSGCAMMQADYMHGLGCTGEGMVIAIIDAGFDTSHENFQGEINNPKLSKKDIAQKIAEGNLSATSMGANVTVNRAYRSEKIPYAFNYSYKNGDTYNASTSHGTHVAGIAAGNNGTDPYGGKFLGTAPDAQLLLMACPILTDAATIAAADDAVKLGADVINASYGADYAEEGGATEKAINTAVKAGVLFSASAGNMARGYNGIVPYAENIDYAAGGIPNSFTAATSVASANNTMNGTSKKTDTTVKTGTYSTAGCMSYFSSWGVTSSLELKPEITAPGGYIYSSVNDDKYRYMSGTSMAAPHMTGAAALMKEYIKANADKYGDVENYGRLIENLLMTTADVIIQDAEGNIPYSPRLQGAGMVNLEKAAKTPVTLIGDVYDVDGMKIEKSKISLKEVYEMNDVKFIARNLTDTDVTYDSITMTVITDSADEDGIVGNMKKLSFNEIHPSSVTVPAKGETEIIARFNLYLNELLENKKVFKNGFFIDGFVSLSNTENAEIPEISIPFTGFYEDWEKAPALDKPFFDDASILGETYMYTVSNRTENGSFGATADTRIMGTNWFVSENAEDYDDYIGEDYVGYSPNGDGNADIPSAVATPLRRLGKNDFAIYDADNNELMRKTDMSSETEYFYCEKFTPTYLYFDEEKTNALPDGDYTFKCCTDFYAMKNYEQNESVEFKFYIDREKPVITKFEVSEDGNSLTIAAEDNRHLMGFVVSGTKNNKPYYKAYPIKAFAEYETTVDITGIDAGTLTVEAVDYAQNSTIRTDAGLNIAYMGLSGSSHLFTVSNTTGGEIKAAVIMALYRDGELVGISGREETIPEGSSIEAFNAENVGYDTTKVFVWDSLDSMTPLYDVFEF